MKNKSPLAILAIILIYSVFVITGCNPSQGTNANVSTNNAAAPNASADAESGQLWMTKEYLAAAKAKRLWTDGACKEGGDIGKKRDAVAEKIAKRIRNSDDLQNQLDRGVFKYLVQIGPGSPGTSLDLFLEGGVGGKGNFMDLMHIIEDFMKSDCTKRVAFVPEGTLKSAAAVEIGKDFTWIICDDGYMACPGGTCKTDCNANTPIPVIPGSGPKRNSNTMSNSNSNSVNK